MKKKIAVYGSLRKGDYNFDRFPSANYLESITIPLKFKMVSLVSYPKLVPSEEENNIVFDIIEVSELDAKFIEDMEIGAGYTKDTFEHEGVEYEFYYHKKEGTHYGEVKKNENKIDWIKFKFN